MSIMDNDAIKQATVVFWDFDGVIKESVDIKTEAFMSLFETHGDYIIQKIKLHHEKNCGMSRFDKFPIYLKMTGQIPTKFLLDEYSRKFSQLVTQKVIEAEWVPCVESFIRNNVYNQKFIVVSATPYNELKEILFKLDLMNCFDLIFGAPVRKSDAIRDVLLSHSDRDEKYIMIGDAKADFDAANDNNILFLLRKHESNNKVFHDYSGNVLHDFC